MTDRKHRSAGNARRSVVAAVAIIVVLSTVPGTALAETRAGGAVVVESGETVEGDLEAFAGSITVRGTIEGDLQAIGGAVRIEGTVTGDVSTTAGTVVIGPDARIEGTLDGAAGDVTIAGTIDGTVQIGASSITIAPSAVLGGDLRYDGELSREDGATISGDVIQEGDLGRGSLLGVSVPGWLPGAYFLAAGLLVGAVLLAVFPDFSKSVADDVATDPLRAGGAGLLALIGVPAVLVGLAITVVGIPLSVIGLFTYLIGLWIGSLYGRYAIGEYVLSTAGVENRWLGLLVGFLAVGVFVRVPLVGGLLNLLVLLLGLGALAEGLYRYYRDRGETGADAGDNRGDGRPDSPTP